MANVAHAPKFLTVLDMAEGAGALRRLDPAVPILTAFDYAATRGDGAFEAMHVYNGLINKPERHIERMERSLSKLNILGPSATLWMKLIEDLAQQWPADVEGVLKLVISRGQEGGPATQPPTVYGTLVPIEDELIRQRKSGIDVVSLTFGYPAAAREQSPWLLGSTKYLSYAINMAAKREAARRNAQDVLFLSSEGEVLEGPNATVIWLIDDILHTTPLENGILAGTTQQLIFDNADRIGLGTKITSATLADLHAAEGVWMSSSTRGITAVHKLDDADLHQSPQTTAKLQELSGLPLPK